MTSHRTRDLSYQTLPHLPPHCYFHSPANFFFNYVDYVDYSPNSFFDLCASYLFYYITRFLSSFFLYIYSWGWAGHYDHAHTFPLVAGLFCNYIFLPLLRMHCFLTLGFFFFCEPCPILSDRFLTPLRPIADHPLSCISLTTSASHNFEKWVAVLLLRYHFNWLDNTTARVCYGCTGKLRPSASIRDPPAPFDIVVSTKEYCCWYDKSPQRTKLSKKPEATHY